MHAARKLCLVFTHFVLYFSVPTYGSIAWPIACLVKSKQVFTTILEMKRVYLILQFHLVLSVESEYIANTDLILMGCFTNTRICGLY